MLTSPLTAHYTELLFAPRGSAAAAPPAQPDQSPGAPVNAAIRAAAGRGPAPASPPPSPPASPAPLDGGARSHSAPPRLANPYAGIDNAIRAAADARPGGA